MHGCAHSSVVCTALWHMCAAQVPQCMWTQVCAKYCGSVCCECVNSSEPDQSLCPKPGVQGKEQFREHLVSHAEPQTDSFGAEWESGTGTLGTAAALAQMCVLS